MSEEEFSQVMVPTLVGGLIILMGFIVWDLSKKSNAGKWGTSVMFLVLGFGVLGFVFKEFLIGYLNG